MSKALWSDKRKFIWVLTLVLLSAFFLTSWSSYQVARHSLTEQIESNTLPLTSDNIYSEIQQDLLRPIFISSLMAHDTFLRDWALSDEADAQPMVRYLKELQERFGTVTSFYVSEKDRTLLSLQRCTENGQCQEPRGCVVFPGSGSAGRRRF